MDWRIYGSPWRWQVWDWMTSISLVCGLCCEWQDVKLKLSYLPRKNLPTALASGFTVEGRRWVKGMEVLAYHFLSWQNSKKESANYICAKEPLLESKSSEPMGISKEEELNVVEVIEETPQSQPSVGKKRKTHDSPCKWGLNNSSARKHGNQGILCPWTTWIGQDF